MNLEFKQNTLSHVLPLLVTVFNDIVSNCEVPVSFKSGILTSVHKKDKDPTSVDNYRCITVTAIIVKVFEYALLDKLTEMGLNRNQSELQEEFSEGLSLRVLVPCSFQRRHTKPTSGGLRFILS